MGGGTKAKEDFEAPVCNHICILALLTVCFKHADSEMQHFASCCCCCFWAELLSNSSKILQQISDDRPTSDGYEPSTINSVCYNLQDAPLPANGWQYVWSAAKPLAVKHTKQ